MWLEVKHEMMSKSSSNYFSVVLLSECREVEMVKSNILKKQETMIEDTLTKRQLSTFSYDAVNEHSAIIQTMRRI